MRAGLLAADSEFMTAKYMDVFANASLGWPAGFSLNMTSGGPSPPLAAMDARANFASSPHLAGSGLSFRCSRCRHEECGKLRRANSLQRAAENPAAPHSGMPRARGRRRQSAGDRSRRKLAGARAEVRSEGRLKRRASNRKIMAAVPVSRHQPRIVLDAYSREPFLSSLSRKQCATMRSQFNGFHLPSHDRCQGAVWLALNFILHQSDAQV